MHTTDTFSDLTCTMNIPTEFTHTMYVLIDLIYIVRVTTDLIQSNLY